MSTVLLVEAELRPWGSKPGVSAAARKRSAGIHRGEAEGSRFWIRAPASYVDQQHIGLGVDRGELRKCLLLSVADGYIGVGASINSISRVVNVCACVARSARSAEAVATGGSLSSTSARILGVASSSGSKRMCASAARGS